MAHTVAVSDEAHEALKSHCMANGIKLGYLLDAIIRRYFKKPLPLKAPKTASNRDRRSA